MRLAKVSKARMKIARMLDDALRAEGYKPVPSVDSMAELIWHQVGGATKLDVARWGLNCVCYLDDDTKTTISIASWSTMTAIAKEQELSMFRDRNAGYEV